MEFYLGMIIITLFSMAFASGWWHIILGILLILEVLGVILEVVTPKEQRGEKKMKQNKALKINTVEKEIDSMIKKLELEINDLELALEDRQQYLEELKSVKEAITEEEE